MSCNHLLIDARDCEQAARCVDEQAVEDLFAECVFLAGLEAACPVRFVTFEPDGRLYHASGLTAFQVLTTSHISIHSNLETGGFYMDVYSCVPFAFEPVVAAVKQAFGRGIYTVRSIQRN